MTAERSSHQTSAAKELTSSATTALRRAAVASLVLALVKLAAFVATGSLVVLTSFFDSATDSLISLVNSRVQKLARTGPDRDHPYGHSGFDVLNGLIQGAALTMIALFIVIEGWSRLAPFLRGDAKATDAAGKIIWDDLPIGLAVLLFAALSGLLISSYLSRADASLTSQARRSISLKADAAHYRGDGLANAINALGLGLAYVLRVSWLDALFAVLGALFIFKASLPIIRVSLRDILQTKVDPARSERIRELALAADSRILGLHRLRVREHGPTTFVDFHLKLPAATRLEIAHDIAAKAARAVKAHLPDSDVLVHLDPDSEDDEDDFD